MVGEGHAVIHEGPQVWQRHGLAKRAKQAIGAHLVKHDKQDIRTRHSKGPALTSNDIHQIKIYDGDCRW
jgi:hypothetical protein